MKRQEPKQREPENAEEADASDAEAEARDGSGDDVDSASAPRAKTKRRPVAAAKQARRRAAASDDDGDDVDDVDDNDDNDDDEVTGAPVVRARASSAAGNSIEADARRFRNLVIQLGFIAAAAAVVFWFVQAARSDQRRAACSATCALAPAYAGRNRTAPDFELPALDGKTYKLSSFRGKTVILNFWASWCDPCREEMPSLARLALAIKNRKDVVFLTVSVDEEDASIYDTLGTMFATDDELKAKIAAGTIPFVVMRDVDMKVVRGLYGTTKYPETWIIDGDGYIRARYDGARDWSSATAFDAIESVGRGAGCLADFQNGKPTGTLSTKLCEGE